MFVCTTEIAAFPRFAILARVSNGDIVLVVNVLYTDAVTAAQDATCLGETANTEVQGALISLIEVAQTADCALDPANLAVEEDSCVSNPGEAVWGVNCIRGPYGATLKQIFEETCGR